MVAGNMGTKDKMNYTIMGNAVNLAARLEGVNKQYGTRILAPENTVREAGADIFVRRLDRVRVVGINEAVRIYELLNTTADATVEQQKLVAVFHEALDAFEARKWRMAAEGFREVLLLSGDDGPSKKFFVRCKNFLSQPPADDWDGVFSLTEK
jgi:adenylate cyclase